jgi:hypothetical protein
MDKEAAALRLRADARERRLRMLTVLFFAAAVVMIAASFMTAWQYEYTAGQVALNAFENTTATARLEISVLDMARIGQSTTSVANPVTSSVGGIPLFLLFGVLAALCACASALIGSAGLAFVALLGYGYTWSALGVSETMFATSGQDAGWTATPGAGITMLTTAVFISVIATFVAGALAIGFQRADRAARIAAGEQVEETTLGWISKKLHAATGSDDTAKTSS